MKSLVYLMILLGTALAQGASLENTRWTLAAYAQGGRFVQVGPEVGATLEFTQNRVGGQTGCNSFGGNYTLEGDTLRFGPLMQTMMACPDEAINRLERAYLQALGQVQAYSLEGSVLRMKNQAGQTLLILSQARPQAILGEWTVTAIHSGNAIASVAEGSKPTVGFGQARMAGNTGCNQFSARYSLQNFSLQVGPVASTKRACPSEALARQETALLQALEKVEGFRIVGRRLTLYDAEGKILMNLSR
ncbi:META domain-containing protein [Meiothermus sp.]|uniref:META domain-containing protein n=1 Tax=Meiothermus sp. TaxID=1955249 RepID=UPI0021DE72CB|nr:META domain-containing protein [Meiothermus sp.]GIW33189.1 MAG: META domain-containing protein [Meiothermus sp.]GIW37414.1 MAG: META domain-containing protein [Meiothermus sp.]